MRTICVQQKGVSQLWYLAAPSQIVSTRCSRCSRCSLPPRRPWSNAYYLLFLFTATYVLSFDMAATYMVIRPLLLDSIRTLNGIQLYWALLSSHVLQVVTLVSAKLSPFYADACVVEKPSSLRH